MWLVALAGDYAANRFRHIRDGTESCLHTLKTELVHHRTYVTRDEAKRDLFSYTNRPKP